VRGNVQQPFALLERLMHEWDFPVLEIAKAPVDQPAGPARGPRGEVGLVQEQDLQSPTRCVAGNSGTVYTPANNDNVEMLAFNVHSGHLPVLSHSGNSIPLGLPRFVMPIVGGGHVALPVMGQMCISHQVRYRWQAP
jgi:hypothetical protein